MSKRYLSLILHNILRKEQPNNADTGLTLGNQSSQCFALLYLNVIDRYFKGNLRVKGYVRYMHDMILVHRDKELDIQIILILKKNSICQL